MTSIDLTKLDFDDIKTSITDYMQSQPNTVGFDWNNTGSIANTVLDLLAYNTMYYAFYSSMLINESYLDTAQRLDSIISLAKPFGTVIQHRSSATANIRLQNTSSSTITVYPYKTAFTAVAPNGLTYVFYYPGGESTEILNPDTSSNQTYNQFDVSPGGSTEITVYEGKQVTEKLPVRNFDTSNQKFDIGDKSIDINTLRVYVQESDGTKQYYRTIDQSDTNLSSRVFTLSTTQSGYSVYFGGDQASDGSFVGRGVGADEQIYYSYVATSGQIVNGAKTFKSGSKLQVKNPNVIARGGVSNIATDTARYMAIRGGKSHGNRLVTVSDYQNYILDLGTINTDPSNPNLNVSVYGSNQAAGADPGIIYWSAHDQRTGTISSTSTIVSDTSTDISDKVMAGLKFEYRTATQLDWTVTLVDKTQLAKLYSEYKTGFNQTIVGSELGWSAAAFSITTFSSTQFKFDVKNPLSTLVVTVLKDGTNQAATLSSGNLVVDGTTIGTYNLTTGIVNLDSTTFTSLVSITGTVDSTESNLYVAKHENLATIAGN